MEAAGQVYIGTSGWSYKGWDKTFYPQEIPKAEQFEFYATQFPTVEINNTFYGQPRAAVSRGWAERTPAGFEFSVKLYQKFTHPGMFKKAMSRTLPADVDDSGELLDALARAVK